MMLQYGTWKMNTTVPERKNCLIVTYLEILCKSSSSSPNKKVNELSKNKDIDSSSTEVRNRHHKNQPIYVESCSSTSLQDLSWKPLLLFIPLRLGLSNMNPIYETSLQVQCTCTYTYIYIYIYIQLVRQNIILNKQTENLA